MSPAESKLLQRAADKLLAGSKARRIMRDIEFDEEGGRRMYDSLPGEGLKRRYFENGECVPIEDGRDFDFDGESESLPEVPGVEGATDVLRFVWHGGPSTPRAILTRLACLAAVAQVIEKDEALKIANCTLRTFQRIVKKCRSV